MTRRVRPLYFDTRVRTMLFSDTTEPYVVPEPCNPSQVVFLPSELRKDYTAIRDLRLREYRTGVLIVKHRELTCEGARHKSVMLIALDRVRPASPAEFESQKRGKRAAAVT